VAGIVRELGAGLTDFQVGDRVAGDQVMVSGRGTAADGSSIAVKYVVPENRKEVLQRAFQPSPPRKRLTPVFSMRRTRKTAQ
jgi:NADPH:quinone reductase-like Zn-dependent oxidoreductase